MAALVFTPGTVFVLAVLAVLSVLAVRRIRSRGLCDSGPAPRGNSCRGRSMFERLRLVRWMRVGRPHAGRYGPRSSESVAAARGSAAGRIGVAPQGARTIPVGVWRHPDSTLVVKTL